MKNVLVLFKNHLEDIPCEYLKTVSDIFSASSIAFTSVELLDSEDGVSFKKVIERNKNSCDNLFIIKRSDLAFDIKGVISETMNTVFCENENAKILLESFERKMNKKYSSENIFIPMEATFIPNSIEPFNAFMMEDESFSLLYLPDNVNQIKDIVSGFILKYFENKYDLKIDVFTAKYFGDKDKLYHALYEIESKYPFVQYNVNINYGDALVKLVFTGGVSKKDYDDVIRLFMTRISDGVYAEFDTTLSERLFDLLRLRNVKVATAESFTAGRVVSSIIKNSGASMYVTEGIVSYSNKSKENRLKVPKEDLDTVGAVSSKVAYKMATGLLTDSGCDLAISTTGFAGPTTNENGKPLGLYYIGIGMKNGVDVYKYHGVGDREEITETAKNTALFLAIKRIKNI